jgi:two-component system CheB/CheR fusion protein
MEGRDTVLIHEEALADHLYRLAQEAVINAVKHGRPKNITIGLDLLNGGGVLTVHDDGCGFDMVPRSPAGLGMRTMNYRAKMIGGSLSVQSSSNAGTVVKCSFPLAHRFPEGIQ